MSNSRTRFKSAFATAACLLSASIALAALASSCSHFGGGEKVDRPSVGPRGRLEFDSGQLLMKNSDQVNELIQRRVKKANAVQSAQKVDEDAGIVVEPEAIARLKDAMRIVLCRPDQDGYRASAYARLDRELNDLNSEEIVLRELSDESIGALQSSDAATNVQATYVTLLENLMAELKPEVTSKPWAKKIFENIRDARLQIADGMRLQQRLRPMARPVSPSETAKSILDSAASNR